MRPDSILGTKSDTSLRFALPSDRRVKIKETPEYEKKALSTKDDKKKKIRVDINLNNLSSTHHIEGGTLSTEEDKFSMKSGGGAGGGHKGKVSGAKDLKRSSCSPQMKRNLSNKIGQEHANDKTGSKLNISVSSGQSKTKNYLKKKP
jgi:hypothetical protein